MMVHVSEVEGVMFAFGAESCENSFRCRLDSMDGIAEIKDAWLSTAAQARTLSAEVVVL
jgi:hypothetical protein